ncbi:MAG: serine--tRNA ligase [Candidatus Diapherotrites archaeon]|nr:serine--tRNA ligase [Candidatus Diapherotrites archaeon]
MLEIGLIRSNPDLVRCDLQKRNDSEKLEWLEDLLQKDKEWRSLKQEVDALRASRNTLSRRVNEAKRGGKDAGALIEEAKKIPQQIAGKEAAMVGFREKIDYYLMRMPNILHDSVPLGKDESENVVVRTWGKPKKPSFEVKHHGQLAAELGVADFERAVKISGAGFFFLKGDLALLDLAAQRFAIDLLIKKGFTLIQPPFMIKRKPYEGVTDLADFENVMYKTEGEDAYLIATSEHPLTAMYMDEILDEGQLPIVLAGVSACFRREIGKHGLDERGLFRVHQFNKIEQIILCAPEESWEWHEKLAENAQELLRKLKIPHNVTNICTGDIGTVAAKKYDINGWSPREGKFFELMSCSNCTAYQSARLGIKFRRKSGEKEFVHTLNSTMAATTRLLRCIIENYQTKQGTIIVPEALRPYMNGIKEIGKAPPANKAEAKKAKRSSKPAKKPVKKGRKRGK